MVDEFLGYLIVEAPCMRDLVQARRHKKKRINKKWRKRYGMKSVPWKKFLIHDRVIYGHPEWIDKLKECMKKKFDAQLLYGDMEEIIDGTEWHYQQEGGL